MSVKTLKAIDALEEAQRIAFAPFIFQTTVSLRKLGVLDLIFETRHQGGITIEGLSKKLNISAYGLGVLLEIAESSDIVSKDDKLQYELTKVGYFLAFNETVDVNVNFTNDVCYKGLYHLNDSIKNNKPEGLKELGEWNTIYEGLSELDPQAKKSWFDFDHHYSDEVFDNALKIVFRNNPKAIFDIGGNTGKFAISACKYSDQVEVTIVDLPGQLNKALENAQEYSFKDRIKGHTIDWLSENPQIPKGADTYWMSQFLDCFSEEEIIKILSVCVDSMDSDSELLIMETFTDRQKFDNARFILEATSLYFTTMANGNSKMYSSKVFETLIDKVGLTIKSDIAVGEYHTIFVCVKK